MKLCVSYLPCDCKKSRNFSTCDNRNYSKNCNGYVGKAFFDSYGERAAQNLPLKLISWYIY